MGGAGVRYLGFLGAGLMLAWLAPGAAAATEWCTPSTTQEAYDAVVAAADDGSQMETEARRIGDEARAQGTFDAEDTILALDDLAYEWGYWFDCDRGVYVYDPEETGDNEPAGEEPPAGEPNSDEGAAATVDEELDEESGAEADEAPPPPRRPAPAAAAPAPGTVPAPGPGTAAPAVTPPPSASRPAPAPITPDPVPVAPAVSEAPAAPADATVPPPVVAGATAHRPLGEAEAMAAPAPARTSSPAPRSWLLLAVPATFAFDRLLRRRRRRRGPLTTMS